MATRRTPEFGREAVRIALTSGLTRWQAASDLGIGFSTPSKWLRQSRDDQTISASDQDLYKEVDRLGKENRRFGEERDLLKKGHGVLGGAKQVRLAFVDEHRHHGPVARLCKTPNITSRRYRAWCDRPVSQRQRDDLVALARIRERHRLSLGSYGRPRMREELPTHEGGVQGVGFDPGDNAAVETVFKTIKPELIWRQHWQTRQPLETALPNTSMASTIRARRRSALGGKSPSALEQKVA